MATLFPEHSGSRNSLSGELPGSRSSTLLGLATYGAAANHIVYLVQQFNVSRIAAAQIFNIVNGCGAISPLVGGIISDSFAGCFSVILAASIISFLGLVPMTLAAILQSLRPPPCTSLSNSCNPPTAFQYAILYVSLALVCVGIGGSRFTMATFGANQFKESKRQETFVNCFFMALYVATILATTVVVFVQDTVGWAWGYGICLAANAISIVIFLIGKWYYKEVKPQGSPFTGISRVLFKQSSYNYRRGHLLKWVTSKGLEIMHHSAVCRKLLGWSPTLLLRIGAGHVLNITSMVASALVEARRLHVAHGHKITNQKDYAIVPMSALWLVAPLVIVGAGEACHLPGQVGLYYEDFPTSLKGTADSNAVCDNCSCILPKCCYSECSEEIDCLVT
ncbi:hypothetical protein EJ110_NYTH33302 [Nymphaea thermarum]|nr:hypothetical protein EJ110_NYTH33302 [Nymphaea thermarum]